MHIKTLKPFVLIIAATVLISLACLSTSATPLPEPNPVQVEPSAIVVVVEPTQTPTPAKPTEPTHPPAQQFFTEEFDSDNEYWDLNIVKNSDASDITKAMTGISDGVFDFLLEGKNLTVYSFYSPFEYDNVKIDLRVENLGTNDNQINIICRASEAGWYEFSIANSGLYKIYAVEPGKGYQILHDGGSTKIKAGKEFNEYSVVCNDRTMSLFINGVETRVFEENKYAFRKGLVGIGVSSFNTLPVHVQVNSVTISQP